MTDEEDRLIFDIPSSMNESGIATRFVYREEETREGGYVPASWVILQGDEEIVLTYDLVWRMRDFVEITMKSHRGVTPLRDR